MFLGNGQTLIYKTPDGNDEHAQIQWIRSCQCSVMSPYATIKGTELPDRENIFIFTVWIFLFVLL